MRDFKGMKRQRGRNRGGGGQPSGGKPQNANRAFDSNGPDNIKVRGHAQHVFEKYQQLARDATSSGDRVLAENFLQHAEHYFRVLRTIQPNRPIADFIARETFASGYDIDFEDESGAQALPDEPSDSSSDGQNDGESSRGDYAPRNDYQQRDNSQREGREPRQDRWENRGERSQRDGQQRDGQQRDSQQRDSQQRDIQQRDGQQRDGQQREGQQREGQQRDGQSRENPSRDNFGRDGQPQRENRDRDRNFRDRDRERPRYEADGEQPRSEGETSYRPRDRDRDRTRDRDDRGSREDRPAQSAERRERSYDRTERSDPLAVVEPQAQPLTSAAPVPEGSMLRSHDGETSHAPAFLQAAATPAAATEETPAKRPRGRPKKAKEPTSIDEA